MSIRRHELATKPEHLLGAPPVPGETAPWRVRAQAAGRSPDAPVVGGLADLPEHRREALLWHFAYEERYGGLDYDGVDDLVRDQSPMPCLRHQRGAPEQNITAALGSDGRYHLCHAGVPVCAGKQRRGDSVSRYRHEQTVHWWVSTTGYHRHPWPGVMAVRQGRLVRWQVELLEVDIDPALVLFSALTAFPQVSGLQDP